MAHDFTFKSTKNLSLLIKLLKELSKTHPLEFTNLTLNNFQKTNGS